ncbi:hypothetical protein Q0Z83_043980 [Actinoplanes sichuanensis]|nr:hypothetical protein Q0Z83_043980 [Actinoplanes sichuanensis]
MPAFVPVVAETDTAGDAAAGEVVDAVAVAGRDVPGFGVGEVTAGAGGVVTALVGVLLVGSALCQGPRVPAFAVLMPMPAATTTTAAMAPTSSSLRRLIAIAVTPRGGGTVPPSERDGPARLLPSTTKNFRLCGCHAQ